MKAFLQAWRGAVAKGEDRVVADRVLAKIRTREATLERPGLAQAFIRLDRVFSADPVRLFGHATPSLAFNRISIHASEPDPETGDPRPGDRLFSGLIGEEMLARFMLNMNRGESEACLTGEELLGHELGPWPDAMPDIAEVFVEELRDKAAGASAAQRGEELAAAVSRLRAPLEGKRASELGRSIASLAKPMSYEFELERHVENVERQRVAAQVEMAHTALHFARVRDAIENRGMLRGPGIRSTATFDRVGNPLLDAFSGVDPEEARVIATAARWEIRRILERAGLDPETYDPASDTQGRKLSSILKNRIDVLPEDIRTLRDAVNQGENQSILDREGQTSPWCMMVSLSEMRGPVSGLHTDMLAVYGSSFRIRIETAMPEVSYGDIKIRSGREVMEVTLMPGDLMTLLRGHPAGDFTRCTLNRFCGSAIPFAPFESRISKILSSLDSPTPEAGPGAPSGLQSHLREAMNLVSSGLPDAASRDRLAVLLREIGHLVDQESQDNLSRATGFSDELRDLVSRDLHQVFLSFQGLAGGGFGQIPEMTGNQPPSQEISPQ